MTVRLSRLTLALLLAAAPATAQRNAAKLTFCDRDVVLEYGVARAGKHTLDEIPVGGTWRLGFNEPSVLRTALPLLAGDTLVAPGTYHASLRRGGERQLSLDLAAGAAAGRGGGRFAFAGQLADAKQSNALTIEWAAPPPRGTKVPTFDAKLGVRFLQFELTVPLQVVGQKPVKVGSLSCDAFTWPADLLQARLDKRAATPVLVVHAERIEKGTPDAFDLVLDGEAAKLLPAYLGPVDGPPGAAPAPDPALVREGKCELAAAQGPQPVLEVKSARLEKGTITLVLLFGERSATVTITDPFAKQPPPAKK